MINIILIISCIFNLWNVFIFTGQPDLNGIESMTFQEMKMKDICEHKAWYYYLVLCNFTFVYLL